MENESALIGYEPQGKKWWYSLTHGQQCNMLFKHGFTVATESEINIMWTKEHGNYPR